LTSSIYNHVTIQNINGDKYFACNYYRKKLKSSRGTKGIKTYLITKHQIIPGEDSVTLKRKREDSDIATILSRMPDKDSVAAKEKKKMALFRETVDQKMVEFLYIQWVASSDIPFDQIKNATFRTFIQYINPVANIQLLESPETIKKREEVLFREGKQRIRQILSNAQSNIHLTCDMWTSRNHLGILAVVAHFYDEHCQLKVLTLALKEPEGVYSGENQASIILDVIDDYQFRNKVVKPRKSEQP